MRTIGGNNQNISVRKYGATSVRFIAMAVFFGLYSPPQLLAQQETYQIQLKSRTFTPAPGITDATKSRHQRALDQNPCTHTYVQFKSLPGPNEIKELKNKGITLQQFIGGNAYIGHLCKQRPLAFTERSVTDADTPLAKIRWMGEIPWKDKIDPLVQRGEIASHAKNADGTWNLRVDLFEDVDLDEAKQAITPLVKKITGQSKGFNRVTIKADPAGVKKVAALDGVRSIGPIDPPRTKFNDGVRSNIGADVVQGAPYDLSGRGVKAGIWDGGTVGSLHPDFSGRLDIVDTQGSTDDHATHVAGTMGGDGNNSQAKGGQPKQWKGVAPNINIFSYFWDDSAEDHEGAIEDKDIDLSQNSWGFTVDEFNCDFYGDYNETVRDYDAIVAGQFGKRIPIIFAAGNERDDKDCGMIDTPPFNNFGNITPPQTAKNVLTVGAINSDDDSMTHFSSWGPVDDGRVKPEVVAPGCERGGERFVKSTLPTNSYGNPGWCGTSMAAPAVSGTVALLMEQYRTSSNGKDPLPSTIKALLTHTAKDLGTEGPDYKTGYGRIQVRKVVDLIKDEENNIQERELLGTGQTESLNFAVKAGTPELKVTLSWDDAPASVTALKALVNDLDLQLVDPNGNSHTPWVLDPNNPSAPASKGVDHTNNLEQVLVKNPPAGDWKIKVRGFAVPQPPQKYSLVIPASLPPIPRLPIIPPSPPATEAFISPGEKDLFQVDVSTAGQYTVETTGPTDVFMSLFGPNSKTNLIKEDDDNGRGRNARITTALQPGVYYVQIRHYLPTEEGPYKISVQAEP